jgi:glutamyl-Q tRNA(Asp) synthetase
MTYIGRFAPSPSGPLHFGSYIAALGSYLDARANKGQWLIRIEDIDPPREVAGAADNILATLEGLMLHWDQTVDYQSAQLDNYQQICEQLTQQGLVYACECTRKIIKQSGGIYQNTCRTKLLKAAHLPYALRLKVLEPITSFTDLIQGKINIPLAQASEDFIIKRRDGLYAYMLAVVYDDHRQGITHVVRGNDLLETTASQIVLYKALGYQLPKFAHLPLIVNKAGNKLSKQNQAPAINIQDKEQLLLLALNILNLPLEKQHHDYSYSELLAWAVENWQLTHVSSQNYVVEPQDCL